MCRHCSYPARHGHISQHTSYDTPFGERTIRRAGATGWNTIDTKIGPRASPNIGTDPPRVAPLALLHLAQSGPAQSHFFYFWRSRSLAPKASHAQRIPLNMGALHCVTGGNTRIYTARTSGEVKSMRHALRLRTTTRGFDATVELQLATSRPCPRSASAEEAGWQQARAVRLRRGHNGEVTAASRAVQQSQARPTCT